MVVAGVGNLEQGFATVQYGGSLGKNVDYRAFTKYFNKNHMADINADDGSDEWRILRGGFEWMAGFDKRHFRPFRVTCMPAGKMIPLRCCHL